MMSSLRPTFRYAGVCNPLRPAFSSAFCPRSCNPAQSRLGFLAWAECQPIAGEGQRWDETCREYAEAAPSTMAQVGSIPYALINAKDSPGFERTLRAAVDSFGVSNVGRMSVVVDFSHFGGRSLPLFPLFPLSLFPFSLCTSLSQPALPRPWLPIGLESGLRFGPH